MKRRLFSFGSNKVVAREYLTVLPEEEILAEEIEKTRRQLELRPTRKH